MCDIADKKLDHAGCWGEFADDICHELCHVAKTAQAHSSELLAACGGDGCHEFVGCVECCHNQGEINRLVLIWQNYKPIWETWIPIWVKI